MLYLLYLISIINILVARGFHLVTINHQARISSTTIAAVYYDHEDSYDMDHQDKIFEAMEQRNIINVLREDLSLSRKQADEFVDAAQKANIIMDCHELHDKLVFFREGVGLSKSRLKTMLLKHPRLVAYALTDDTVQRGALQFLQDDLQLSQSQIKSLTADHPSIYGYYRDDLRRVLVLFRSPLFDLSTEELKTLCLKRPQLLGFTTDKIKRMANCFGDQFNIHGKELGKIVLRFPLVLGASDNKVQLVAKFLFDELFSDNSNDIERMEYASHIVKRLPQIFGYNIDKNLRPKIEYLKATLGLDADEMSKMVRSYPSILSLSVEKNVQPKINFLIDRIGLTKQEIKTILQATPSIIGLSFEKNLKQKLIFFVEDCGLSKEKLAIFMLQTPGLLTYNFDRIKSRVRSLTELELSLEVAPVYILGLSEKRFLIWVKNYLESYEINSD